MDILKTLLDKIKSNEIDKESAKEIIQTLECPSVQRIIRQKESCIFLRILGSLV